MMDIIKRIAKDSMKCVESRKEFSDNLRMFSRKDIEMMKPDDSDDLEGDFYSFYNSDKKLIGLASITDTGIGENDKRSGGFITIGVCDEFKGKGFSKKILDIAIKKSNKDDVYASIDKGNYKSINLHKEKGFVESSENRKKYIKSLGINLNDGNIRLHKKVKGDEI